MKSTYINDNLTSIYPFKHGSVLPISDACITGFGVAIVMPASGDSVEFYISQIAVQDYTTVVLTVCMEVNGSSHSTIGSVTASISGDSVFIQNKETENKIHVWAVLGRIQGSDIGEYNCGRLYIDPRCVTVIQKTVYSKYNSIWINENRYPLSNSVRLAASGQIRGTVIDRTDVEHSDTDPSAGKLNIVLESDANATDGFVISPVYNRIPVITDINGTAAGGSTDTLKIVNNIPDVMLTAEFAEEDSDTVVIKVTGDNYIGCDAQEALHNVN